MQTIQLDSRVMVAREFRHVAEDDDTFWTGIVADTDDDDGEQLCLVRFDEDNEWWHTAATLTVLD